MIEDEDMMQEQVDKVAEAVAAKADQPIHDEPPPPEPPPTPAKEPTVSGLRSGWGGHDASKGIQRDAAPGVAAKTGWGGGKGIKVPKIGTWGGGEDEED